MDCQVHSVPAECGGRSTPVQLWTRCTLRRFWTCKSILVIASWQWIRAEPGAAGGTTIGAARYMGSQSKEHTYDGAA